MQFTYDGQKYHHEEPVAIQTEPNGKEIPGMLYVSAGAAYLLHSQPSHSGGMPSSYATNKYYEKYKYSWCLGRMRTNNDGTLTLENSTDLHSMRKIINGMSHSWEPRLNSIKYA